MTTTITMENPDNPPGAFATIVSEYWPMIISAAGGLGALWGYVRFVHRRGKPIWAWLKNALNAPLAIAELKANMVLREEFDGLKNSVQDMRTMQIRETVTRRDLFQHSDVAFFEADKNGRIVWVNTAYLTMVDRELHEVSENNWRNSIHDLDRAVAFDAWRMAVNDCTDFRFKFRISTDNAEFWVAAEALCTKDDLGNVLSFAGALRKIQDPRIHKSDA
jgi:PAS domain S-box-containing protein